MSPEQRPSPAPRGAEPPVPPTERVLRSPGTGSWRVGPQGLGFRTKQSSNASAAARQLGGMPVWLGSAPRQLPALLKAKGRSQGKPQAGDKRVWAEEKPPRGELGCQGSPSSKLAPKAPSCPTAEPRFDPPP